MSCVAMRPWCGVGGKVCIACAQQPKPEPASDAVALDASAFPPVGDVVTQHCQSCGRDLYTLHGRMWSDVTGEYVCDTAENGIHLPPAGGAS